MKKGFASKKGKFEANLMQKSYSNKILNHLADSNESELVSKYKLSNYYLKAVNFLAKN